MPEWMAPYRSYLESGGGGNTIEELMNDDSTFDTNVVMSALAVGAGAKVTLLTQLQEKGLLKTDVI